ncbi:lipopolysaccharide core heptose(I) kinase RfaP [Aromatoleum diolicum]|uniref:Lipopolysaccharide core heptose(I) kinase n=1 Tax=Aromatoleum diolicum TaxID=75796 RepID=A0ABX1QFM4_9RHOO|nr:lipopolysaccharide core heptose(I) kinase RfaP [Aromatoleum diolicum]NMG77199.1 lipopolysaccharide core heptose(I) kinase RfaP [Aromatoleum diolicum]
MTIVSLAEPFATLWAGRDPFAAAAALTGEIVRDIDGRLTFRFEVNGRGYYAKLHRGIGWGEIAKNLVRLRLPVLGAGNEWRAIQAFHARGLGTMTAVAYGERGRGPARRESFLITEALEPAADLDTYTRDWARTPPPVALKRALIARVASIARGMHEAGINHRDFYLCHFLLDLEPAPSAEALRLSVIDLHRAQLRPRTPRRWRDKDLAALYFSALDIGLTRRDKLRFLRDYFPGPLRATLQREARLLRHLEREAARLKRRYERKFAHRPALQR